MSTASGLEREIKCAASAVLNPSVNRSNDDAQRGHEVHAFVRSCIAGTPRGVALAALTHAEWRETAEQIDFVAITAGLRNVRAEVSYRLTLDPEADDVAREIGVNLGRRYPMRGVNEIDGTNDIEGQSFDGSWVVIDLKTGFELVTRCKDNPQMKFHAKALMLVHDVDRVEARVGYIEVDGKYRPDTHVFTRFELDRFGDELLERRARIDRANDLLQNGGRLSVTTGDHCRYCPVLDVCPAYTAMAHAMLTDLREVHGKWGSLTAEEKTRAFEMAYEARDLAERVVESVKTMARVKPIELSNGKMLRETGSGVRVVNAPRSSRRGRTAA